MRNLAGEQDGYNLLKLKPNMSGIGDTDTSNGNDQQRLEVVCIIDGRISDTSPARCWTPTG